MKLYFTAIAMLFILGAKAGRERKTELYSSKYYTFYSDASLNAHLFLYYKAAVCKFGKVPDDSLASYVFKDKQKVFDRIDLQSLNNIVRFYRDSLLKKDLLFDSLMRNFCDYLAVGNASKIKLKKTWQTSTFEYLKAFQPYFAKLYWPAIDSANKVWLNANKNQITAMENVIVPELEKIYKTKMPDGKIRVDLVCQATWAGAYSYKDSFSHIVFSTAFKANQGDHAPEVLFHETSHFLVDKLEAALMAAGKRKHVEKDLGLWHDMIFYTTGFVVEKQFKLKWQKFEPYYIQMKFPEKFPLFKLSVEACKLYWDPYLNENVNFETALDNLVTYVLEKQP